MQKRNFITLVFIGAITSVASANDFGGADWKFNYSGHYNVANVNATNNGVLANLLGSTLNLTAQLNLINGTSSANNYGTTINQSSLGSMQVNDLQTTTIPGPGLVPALGDFVFDLLDFSDGIYNGSMSGSNVTLTRGSLISADVLGFLDTRVLGTGLVLDLQADVPTATLTGQVTGVDPGPSAPWGGGRANFITGDAGLTNTIALKARIKTYALGILAVDTGYLNIAAIENRADSWSLSREAAAPVPEPASMATVGLGLIGFIAKRKRRKSA